MVHRKRLQARVTTVRVSSSRQGLRLGLGLATRHVKKGLRLGLGLATRHVKKGLRRLGLPPVARRRSRRLGLPPVARGRSKVTDRVTCRRHGVLMIPRRLCDRKRKFPPILVASWSFPSLYYLPTPRPW